MSWLGSLFMKCTSEPEDRTSSIPLCLAFRVFRGFSEIIPSGAQIVSGPPDPSAHVEVAIVMDFLWSLTGSSRTSSEAPWFVALRRAQVLRPQLAVGGSAIVAAVTGEPARAHSHGAC